MLSGLLSILWARRAVFIIPVVGAFLGSAVMMAVTPPRYVASARVILNYVKPDPDTGVVIPNKMADTYERTQIDFVRQADVAALAAEALGWLESPDLQDAYIARDPRDTRDFRSWVAARLAGGIGASMVEDSNILEIRYSAATPEAASAVAGALREAYLQASTNQLRQSADEKANADAARLAETQSHLAQLEAEKTRLERETGLVLDARNRELDSTRLGRMVTASAPKPILPAPPSRRELSITATAAALDSEVASGAQGLGPNNPQYQALMRQRDQMKAVANDLAGHNNAVNDFFQAQARAEANLFEALKAKVLSQRAQALRLKLVQDQIDQERAVAATLSQATAEQRQLTGGEQSALTAVGEPSKGKESIRSNAVLIVSTAVGMGALYGALLALLVEFLARQIRTPAMLQVAARAPVIGVVPRSGHRPGRRPSRARAKGFTWRGRPAPAQA